MPTSVTSIRQKLVYFCFLHQAEACLLLLPPSGRSLSTSATSIRQKLAHFCYLHQAEASLLLLPPSGRSLSTSASSIRQKLVYFHFLHQAVACLLQLPPPGRCLSTFTVTTMVVQSPGNFSTVLVIMPPVVYLPSPTLCSLRQV